LGFEPGQLVQYAITVSNRSTSGQSYIISAQVPNNTTVPWANIWQAGLQSVTCAGVEGTTCTGGKTIQWGNSTGYPVSIAAGQSFTVTFAALVDTASAPTNGTVIRASATARGLSGPAGRQRRVGCIGGAVSTWTRISLTP
jgi:hypothetical protein